MILNINPDSTLDNYEFELCQNLNGTLIKMGPGSNTFINIFDILFSLI